MLPLGGANTPAYDQLLGLVSHILSECGAFCHSKMLICISEM